MVCQGLSSLIAPLTRLTRKGVKFELDDKCKESFQMLKEKLTTVPILTILYGSDGFVIYNDASINGFGCVLMQHGKVIAYGSR